MLLLYQLHDLSVDLGLSFGGAGKGGVAAQILVGDGFQGDHVKVVAHAVAGDHGAGQLRGLLDVVGSARGDGAECHFLSSAAAGKCGDLVFDLFLTHEIMVALIHLHGVAQGSGGSGDDGDLLHRRGMGLLRRDQRVADLMIGDDLFLMVRQDGILLLVSGDDHLDALLQIRLGHHLPAVAHRAQSGFVDDVGKLRAGSAGGHAGDHGKVHIGIYLHLFRVHLQDFFPALQVRKLHGHPPVEPAGTKQGRIQGFRTVGGGKDDDAGVSLEAVHLGEQLVQRLLPFIVSAVLAVPLLADGVDFVDEHDAGRLFLRLLKQVAHLGRAHAHEHFHEFRTRNGKEGNVRLAGDRLRQHGLAGSGRAHQKDALGHGCADLLILLRVVQIVDDLGQVFLRLILSGHIAEADAGGGLHVNLRAAFSHAEHHGISAHFVHRSLVHPLAQAHKDRDGQHPGKQEAHEGGRLLHDLLREYRAAFMQPFRQPRIEHRPGLVDLRIILIGEDDLIAFHLNLTDIFLVDHVHEGAVIHLPDAGLQHAGHDEEI